MSDFENSRIEKLKRSLYSRDESSVPKTDRTDVPTEEYDAPKNWGTTPSFEISPDVMVKKSNSFFNKFLMIAVLFFLLSVGLASFIFFGGFNMISSNNVDIKVVGSNSVASGEELDLNLSVINQNRTDLQNAVLYIEYPGGVEQTDASADSRVKVNIGTLAKGQSYDYPIKATFFGEKDSTKSIKFKIDYNVAGSNALFSKEKNYDVSINSSPIIMDISYPKEVNSGQEVTISISLTSNSAEPIKNNLLKIDYPYGFTYTDSSSKPLSDNSLWNIGDLKNGDKKTLVIKGQLVGQNMEDRSFDITAGNSKDSSKDFDTTLAVNQITMGIRKSFFDLNVINTSNQDDGGVNIDISSPISIQWQNTLPDKIINSVVTAKISGNVFDKSRISVNNGGLYSSANSSVVWDKNSIEALREIAPGKNGAVTFSLGSVVNFPNIKAIKNPHIDISVNVTGDRTGLDASTVTSSAQKTIKYNSVVSLLAKSHRSISGMSNTGTVPPKVDRETTYTLTWTISNTSNDLKDGVVTAVLPVGVVWKGETYPSGEKITYDADSRVVTWAVGNISYSTGYSYSPREVSFKVGVTPNATQVGQTLKLSDTANLSATDTYTNSKLKSSFAGPGTEYSDPDYTNNLGSVVN